MFKTESIPGPGNDVTLRITIGEDPIYLTLAKGLEILKALQSGAIKTKAEAEKAVKALENYKQVMSDFAISMDTKEDKAIAMAGAMQQVSLVIHSIKEQIS